MKKDSLSCIESYRAVIRALSVHEKEILHLADENQYMLSYLLSQLDCHAGEVMDGITSNDDDVDMMEDEERVVEVVTITKKEKATTGLKKRKNI
jgi:hypothetical protein